MVGDLTFPLKSKLIHDSSTKIIFPGEKVSLNNVFFPPLFKFHINYYDAYFNKLIEKRNNDNILFFHWHSC